MSRALPYFGRTLAVFPHPDDEFACAGVLAMLADAGRDPSLLTLTHGEAGDDRTGAATSPADLATMRSTELTTACALLGVTSHVAGLPDGSLAELGPTKVASVIIDAARHQDGVDTLVTFDLDGMYGHRDHVVCTEAVLLAARALGAAVYGCAFERGRMRPIWQSLRRRRGDGITVAEPAAGFGRARREVEVVDVRAVADRKRAAMLSHASQLRQLDPPVFLRKGLLEAVLVEEWYVRLNA